jgi:hypothetical protein
MEANRPKNLEELIHRELSQLPDCQAPETLIPLVLARIQAQIHKSWWQRPWSQWPLVLQMASLPFLFGGAAGFVVAMNFLWSIFSSAAAAGPVADHLVALTGLLEVLGTLGNAVLILTRSTGPLWFFAGISIVLAMYLACIGLGSVCYRLAIPKR